MNKTDFDDKLTSFNKRITSSKSKNLEVQKKLNRLITEDYNFWGVEFILQESWISKHICLLTNT